MDHYTGHDMQRAVDRACKAEAARDRLAARVAELEGALEDAFRTGYDRGHHDTCESCYHPATGILAAGEYVTGLQANDPAEAPQGDGGGSLSEADCETLCRLVAGGMDFDRAVARIRRGYA